MVKRVGIPRRFAWQIVPDLLAVFVPKKRTGMEQRIVLNIFLSILSNVVFIWIFHQNLNIGPNFGQASNFDKNRNFVQKWNFSSKIQILLKKIQIFVQIWKSWTKIKVLFKNPNWCLKSSSV